MKVLRYGVVVLFLISAWTVWGHDVDGPAKFSVWLPGLPWALQLDGTGFTTKANEIQKGGRRYFVAENATTHVIVSVYLEPTKGAAHAADCKESLEDKVKKNSSLSDSPLRGVAFRENGGMRVLEFTMTNVDGVPVNQKNVFGCIARDDAFVDIHISKILFKEADRAAFDGLLQSFAVVPKEASNAAVPTGSSLQLFQEGSRSYVAGQFRESIAPYQKALDIEKSTQVLPKNYWRVLIDNLGVAYGITGDLARAKATLEYGVGKDPEYPNFYYNLACVSAEKGDVRETEKYLRLGFERRNNVIAGETFPDARVDDSFQKLMQGEEFRAFVEALYGGK